MASRRLPNYLKTYRKRSGLSQDEVAALLGCQTGAKVSRYEHFARVPTLETALACEALFGVPARELFAGMYQKVEKTIHQRAQALAGRLNATDPDRVIRQKLERLQALAAPARSEPKTHGVSLNP